MVLRLRFNSVYARLGFWFLAIALLPLAATFTVIYFQRVEARKAEAYAKLTAIRDLKVHELNSWLNERQRDLLEIASSLEWSSFEEVFGTATQTREESASFATTQATLNHYQQTYKGFSELLFIDATSGHVTISTRRESIGTDYSTDPLFTIPNSKNRPFLKDIHLSFEQKPEMALAVPVHNMTRRRQTVGAVVARIDLDQTLYPRLLDRTGMGKTGETLIVNRAGVALNELRFYDHAPLNLKITAQPATLGARGLTGIIEVEDYRHEMVLAAYTHIHQTGWGFVSKQDLWEINEPIDHMLGQMLVALAISTVLVIGITAIVARTLSRPVLAMARVAGEIQSGDLQARCTVETTDEMAALGRSINAMTDALSSQVALHEGQALITAALVGSSNAREFAARVLTALMEITDSEIGAFFVRRQHTTVFELVHAVGLSIEKMKSFDATSLEGQFGEALATREIAYVSPLPTNTVFAFRSIIGESIPLALACIPLTVDNRVEAVVPLASHHGFNSRHRIVLDLALSSLNTAMSSILAGEQVERTAAELQIANESLRARTDELQAQAAALRKLAQELDEQREQVEQADRLKTEFLSNISHELRTPLNSILALSQLLVTRGIGHEPKREIECLQVIERNGQNLLNLINDILDLSKVEAGQIELVASDFSPIEVLKRAIDTTRPLAEDKGITVEMTVEPHLPRIRSDAEKIEQILINLLSNAIKFTDVGGVQTEARVQEGMVQFSISDTGIGIPADQQGVIFDAFRQVDGSVTRDYGGTGLGLSISKKLAAVLDGDIRVESETQKGSTFTLSIPVRHSPTVPEVDGSVEKSTSV